MFLAMHDLRLTDPNHPVDGPAVVALDELRDNFILIVNHGEDNKPVQRWIRMPLVLWQDAPARYHMLLTRWHIT